MKWFFNLLGLSIKNVERNTFIVQILNSISCSNDAADLGVTSTCFEITTHSRWTLGLKSIVNKSVGVECTRTPNVESAGEPGQVFFVRLLLYVCGRERERKSVDWFKAKLHGGWCWKAESVTQKDQFKCRLDAKWEGGESSLVGNTVNDHKFGSFLSASDASDVKRFKIANQNHLCEMETGNGTESWTRRTSWLASRSQN